MADALNAPGLMEYFRDLVREVLSKRKHGAKEGVEFYLVNLLNESVTTADLYGEHSEGFREEPLAFLYLRALRADTALRVKLLKRLGDFSLFITGFFPQSLHRQLVDIGYYVQMGENAYGCLSAMLARRSALAEIFSELAGGFVSYMDILSEVSEKASVRRDTDLLRLYELWIKTGSRRAADVLAAEGIQPVPTVLKLPN